MAHGIPPATPQGPPAALRERLQRELRRTLGEPAELVSVRADGDRRVRGLVLCAGRVLSFVLDAEEQRLRTQPLLELLRINSAPVAPS
ncbi:MAG: hypothetical protein RLZZ423_592 [Cyanobacteriota bacterium]|jgi:hypothetical protein